MKKLLVITFLAGLFSCGNEQGGGEPQFVDSNNTKIRDGRTGPIADTVWSGKENESDTLID
ncbi:hypothetical protein U0035_00255 [Niabella yanshanensis]|uniref:Uncharacterized protein n=1 Tax=Niabella yanshanensis TaxID=577386 RepID=A0ABZ0W7V9_9BACT|nr:hypothetical protein [Niabella yanshanensis]WQD38577.1 hypothetical protein U0035_00255 [Niabella yanshanensis]